MSSYSRVRWIHDEWSPIPRPLEIRLRRARPLNTRSPQRSSKYRIDRLAAACSVPDRWTGSKARYLLGIRHQSVPSFELILEDEPCDRLLTLACPGFSPRSLQCLSELLSRRLPIRSACSLPRELSSESDLRSRPTREYSLSWQSFRCSSPLTHLLL